MTVTDLPALNATLNATCAVLLVDRLDPDQARPHRAASRRDDRGRSARRSLFLISYLDLSRAGRLGALHEAGADPHRLLHHPAHAHRAGGGDRADGAGHAVARAASGRTTGTARIARWTLPIWLYVSVTGVIVYVMLYR